MPLASVRRQFYEMLQHSKTLDSVIANGSTTAGSNAEAVLSLTPANGYQVKNIYVDADFNPPKLVYEYDDALMGVNENPGLIASNPPLGNYFKVENVCVDEATGRLVFTYDDGT